MVSKTVDRIGWIDALKLVTIYFVVWGHVILFMGLPSDEVYTDSVYCFIYSFHMPLFMMISGFFATAIIRKEGNIKKKFMQLIVPCITLFVICCLLDINSLNCWYLKSLFICYVIFDLLYLVGGKITLLISVFLAILLFPLIVHFPIINNYKIDFMLPFFGLGLLIRNNLNRIEEYLNWYLLIFAISFFICLLFWNKNFIYYFSVPNWINYKELLFNNTLSFDFNNLLEVMFRYFTGAVGGLFFFCLFGVISKFLPKLNKQMNTWGKYGMYTLQIYILQSFLVEVNPFSIQFPTESRLLYSFVFAPFFYFCIVVLCIILAKFMEKNRYVAFFLFGKQFNYNVK